MKGNGMSLRNKNKYLYFANQIIVISNLLLQLNTKILKKSLGKLAESKQAFSDHFKQ